jgi:hypothetical protein
MDRRCVPYLQHARPARPILLQWWHRVQGLNPGANTTVFAKVDVTFGDDVDGVGGKAGMRVSW